MVKTTVNNIVVNYYGSFEKDYRNLTKKGKSVITELICKLTDLISFSQENEINFCRMSFVHYLESKRLIIRVAKTIQELDVKLE